MNESKLQSPKHSSARTVLRVGGVMLVLLGLLLMIVGVGSFFAAFGGFEPPRYFWCVFAGMPLLFVGLVMCKLGFLGAVYRYMAGETAPVAKDTINYLGEGTQPGVKAFSKAVSDGIRDSQQDEPPKPQDPPTSP